MEVLEVMNKKCILDTAPLTNPLFSLSHTITATCPEDLSPCRHFPRVWTLLTPNANRWSNTKLLFLT